MLFFARRKGIEQAALLLVRERNNARYTLIRVSSPESHSNNAFQLC
jgi:hypothetical protein